MPIIRSIPAGAGIGYPAAVSTSGRRFELHQCLGRGSFGEVYAASMRSAGGLTTRVAVKLLRADIDLASQAVRRLRDEGRLLARLNHPAILRVYDLVRLDGRLALITELVEGQDLAELISGEDAFGPRALVQAVGHVANALDAALQTPGDNGPLRMVHRDVKPSNIRIDRHGHAKLLDFGIARFDASDREVRTASDMVVGSIPYMAPERFVQRDVDPSSDVFSLGCTLYEGLVHERFYAGHKVASITAMALRPENYARHLHTRLERLDAWPALRELLGRMLEGDWQKRPTAAEVGAALEALADDMEGPSLRLACRDRSWPGDASIEGDLCGRVLDEGELIDQAAPDRSRSPAAPVVQHTAPETAETPLQDVPRAESDLDRPYTVDTPVSSPEVPETEPTLVPEGSALSTYSTGEISSLPTVILDDEPRAGAHVSPKRVSEPAPDRLWLFVFVFVAICAALGLASLVGFVTFTLMIV